MEKYIINKNTMQIEYYENNKKIWSYTIKENEISETIKHIEEYNCMYEVIEKYPINEVEEKAEHIKDLIYSMYEDDLTNFSIDYDICMNETFSHIYFETYKNYAISICISMDHDINKIVYEMDTKNLNRKTYSIYEDENKNKKIVKTEKGVLGYIKKFMVLDNGMTR